MAIEITGTRQRQAWLDKVLPPVERVRPGLWSIPVPLPHNPLRYVLVYALELPDGLALVDAGWDTPEAWQALTDGIAATGHAVTDVRAVLVTHIHPDHYGLAGRVREHSGAWVALHSEDAKLLGARYGDVDAMVTVMDDHMRRHGVPDTDRGTLAAGSRALLPFIRFSDPDVLLEDGTEPDLPNWRLRTVWTPGHSPGHVCFYAPDRSLLLSGDHVLPRITPMISQHPQAPGSPLADFLDSLQKVATLPADEVLPAHEYRFAGLADRAAALAAHHEERLTELAGAVAAEPGATAWQLARGLTWSRPWDQIAPYMRRAALGETLAHLTVLAARGAVAADHADPVGWSPARR